jgi:uncharacterized phage-associated protein
MICFSFDEITATEATAYLLSKCRGEKRDYGSLLKLLYLADKEALIQTNRTITGDEMVGMGNGTLLSKLYDFMKPLGKRGEYFNRFIAKPPEGQWDVRFIRKPPNKRLSEAEKKILDSVFSEHGNKTFDQLIDLTHELREWEELGIRPQEKMRKFIDPKRVLEISGKSRKEIEEAEINAQESFVFA